jgi:hypothetical protein
VQLDDGKKKNAAASEPLAVSQVMRTQRRPWCVSLIGNQRTANQAPKPTRSTDHAGNLYVIESANKSAIPAFLNRIKN